MGKAAVNPHSVRHGLVVDLSLDRRMATADRSKSQPSMEASSWSDVRCSIRSLAARPVAGRTHPTGLCRGHGGRYRGVDDLMAGGVDVRFAAIRLTRSFAVLVPLRYHRTPNHG